MTLAAQSVLLELVIYHSHSQRSSVYRDIYFLEQIRHTAYMILMAVCYDQTFYLFHILFKIGKIRNDYIYSEHLVFRKSKTAVYDQYLVITLDQSTVFPYLLHSSQRNDPVRDLIVAGLLLF
jgi:hypothetical protein